MKDKYQFIIKIGLSDHFNTPAQVAKTLIILAANLLEMDKFDGDSCGVRDGNGNRVGNWKHDYIEQAEVS